MTQAGAVVKEEVVRALIVLITNAPDLHAYAARAFYSALKGDPDAAEFALVMASTWIIGAAPINPNLWAFATGRSSHPVSKTVHPQTGPGHRSGRKRLHLLCLE